MSLHLIKYVLLAAFRDRMLWGVVAISLLGACLSLFSGSAAIIEQDQFVISYMAGGIRILSLMGLVLFVVFYIRRSFDARDVEFLLTRPISRVSFVLSHVVAFSILSIMSAGFLALLLFFVVQGKNVPEGMMLWAFGVMFEYIIVSNTAFFFSMVLGSPVTAGLSTLGFYVLSRMMGGLLAISDQVGNSAHAGVYKGLSHVMDVVSVIIPRLDLMAQTSWLIYGDAKISDWGFILLQGVVFLSLVVGATIIDLKRKQF